MCWELGMRWVCVVRGSHKYTWHVTFFSQKSSISSSIIPFSISILPWVKSPILIILWNNLNILFNENQIKFFILILHFFFIFYIINLSIIFFMGNISNNRTLLNDKIFPIFFIVLWLLFWPHSWSCHVIVHVSTKLLLFVPLP